MLNECFQLYERGKVSECLKRLLPTFLGKSHPTIEEYWLMSKLLINKPTLNRALLKRALAGFDRKVGLKELISAKKQGQKVSLPDETQVEIYIELSIVYLRMVMDLEAFQECKDLLVNLAVVAQMQGSQWGVWLVDQINRMIEDHIAKRELVRPREDQLAEYQRLLLEQEETKYFKQEGLFGYLIPTQWIRKWKSFVALEEDEEVIKLDDDNALSLLTQEELSQFNVLLGIDANSMDEEVPQEYPGPLDGSRLYDFQWDLLVDPFGPKKHQNYSLRPDLSEGKDFVFVNHKLFAFFSDVYGGIEAKRMIISHQHTKKSYVDLQGKSIAFIVIPACSFQTEYKVQVINIGSKENLEAATKKLTRIFGKKIEKNFPASRWWKFSQYEFQTDFVDKLVRDQRIPTKAIKGAVIEQLKTPLEELEVTDADVFIFEVKEQNSQWQLTSLKNQPVGPILEKNNLQISRIMQDYDISPVPRFTQESRYGLTGLQNLGNTCFMNSALQCLSNVYEFTEYMVSNDFVPDLNPKNPIGTKGFLAATYGELMKAIWYGKSSSVSAWELKRVIGKFAPQFYGYGQQDSQELLSYVLDGLHEDLNRILNKPTIADIEIENQTDKDAAGLFWTNYLKRNNSRIVDLAAGQFKSTLDCPNCGRKSKTYDPFLSISLPIPNYSLVSLKLYLVFADPKEIPLSITLNLSSDLSTRDIMDQIGSMLKINAQQLEPVLSKDHKIKEFVKTTADAKWINEHEAMLFVHQIERKGPVITPDETFIILNYLQKVKGLLSSDEKLLSFSRLMALNRKLTLSDLYLRVYRSFRPHFINAIKQLDDKLFPTALVRIFDELNERNIQKEIDELHRIGKLPFTVKYQDRLQKNKPLPFTVNDQLNLSSISQELKVDLVIADYLRPELLKLQRCKQYKDNDSPESIKKKSEYSLNDCLQAFTKVETLGKGDEWYCNKCKNHVNAKKKMEVYKAPQILILHLKRFRTNRIHNLGSYYFSGGSQKITSLISFPVQNLDLNSYVLSKRDGDPIDYTYDLFGVSNHFGGMGGGHYTAYAYSQYKRQWIDYNDSSVRAASTSDIVSEAAYLLFYRRRDAKPCGLFSSK